MSNVSEFNEKFLYTKTSPENILAAPMGAWFFRKENDFYLNLSGDVNGTWSKLPYRTVIIPFPPLDKEILFEQPMELWFKSSNGFIDEYNVLHPKVGWVFYAYNIDVFLPKSSRVFSWIFPPPTTTSDPIGINGNRSFDENFFYAKESGSWLRTPIAIFTDSTPIDSGEIPYWYQNLPFVDAPRKAPRPITISESGLYGEQSYDFDYFYIHPSIWKRTQLINFSSGKMTAF
jgi:hypothetical protein